MNLQATQPHESKPAGNPDAAGSTPPATGRFAYASGSRPLAGYTIKRGIGHGGFGEVYYATSDAGKEVALKLIRRNWDVELRGVTQCLNLKHPNLLSLYDVKQDAEGDNWVVMELMSDHSLEEELAKHPDGLPLDETLAWIHGIAAGVAYLHDHGIVHRDLKPGNIFVDEGIVKIGDYGLSKFMSCSRRSGQTGSVGTVHYMAPEIANGKYGKEIDIYALGIILYEMLTGHVPFEGESVGEILMKHLTAEPNLDALNEPYRSIVSRALAKDPQTRFASANELIAMLPAVPPAAALTAAARYAGPNPAMAAASSGGAKTAGYSLAPEVAAANQKQSPPNAQAPFHQTFGKIFPDAQSTDPVAHWFRETWTDASAWWTKKNFKPWQKLLILLAALFVAFNVAETSGFIAEAGGRRGTTFGEFLIFVGIVYWMVRRHQAKKLARESAAVQSTPAKPIPTATAARAAAVDSPAVPVRQPQPQPESQTRRRWQKLSSIPLYQPGPPRQRIAELLGSMLLSTLICLVVGLVVMMLRGHSLDTDQYAWLAASSTLGAWAVLIPSKLWEGTRGDEALRRFVMLVMGLIFGAAAYGLMSWLMVSLHPEMHLDSAPFHSFNRDFYSAEGTPQLAAFLAYFGFLMVLPRWWKQADPLRSTRISIWHTLCVVFWSWVLTLVWGFPQPWGLMLTATVAIAVQLASPWLSPSQRAQLPRPAAGG
jgi:Protein kinase domain